MITRKGWSRCARRAHTVAYAGVITAQTQELADRQSALSTRENSLVAPIQLIEALGGGWDGKLKP